MSTITTDQGIVHYEVYGRGRPVLLLHGWLGSWGVWQETMAYLQNDFRTYALDFWGFGESGKPRASYDITDFVGLVDQFMDKLGIRQAPLIGHSMGGTVSLAVAVKYPQRVSKVGIIGSPIMGRSLALPLKLAGYAPIAWAVHNMLWALKVGLSAAAPYITQDPRWPDMINQDLDKTTLDSFLLSIRSLRKTDLRPLLSEVHVPVLGIYGRRDNIVNPRQGELLQGGAGQPRVEYMEHAGHFPMLDQPRAFMAALKDFLDAE
ncbi:MAG: alpha/beta hydrolase [Chloroflexi bacterium]|nr:alpha/beta hydrolase [Chloroflexota bacterium]